MYAANNEGIVIVGAIFAQMSGENAEGDRIETAEMIYVTDLFYLSRRAMENLQIIGPNFPSIGTLSDSVVSNQQTADCGC